MSDTELMSALEELLRSDGVPLEFWFDDDTKIIWAGDKYADDLRSALTKLLEPA